jgi:hypothetical protein
MGLVEREIRLDLGELGNGGSLDFCYEGLSLCERAKVDRDPKGRDNAVGSGSVASRAAVSIYRNLPFRLKS